jgi:hypothetical protein
VQPPLAEGNLFLCGNARSHEELEIQLKNLRLHLQAGRQAATPRTLRDWWRWLPRDRLMNFLDNVTHFTEEERAKIISSYPAHEREEYGRVGH